MATSSENTCVNDDEILAKLISRRPEIGVPGYWEAIGTNAEQWAHEASAMPFWVEARKKIDQWRTEYKQKTNADLLTQSGLPQFSGKLASSIKGKVLRKCRECADEAETLYQASGPAVPLIGDLVRTRIVCRYIDGVEFLASKMESLAKEMGLMPKRDREGRLEGYFAQHLTLNADVFYRFATGSVGAKIRCEVQLASELADTMWNSSHPFYEFARENQKPAEVWQWDPTDPQFIANQLGHMIHLADGLIVHLRNSQKRGDKK